MDIKEFDGGVPMRSERIAWLEFIELTGAHPSRLGDLIELGWLAPIKTSKDRFLFKVSDVYRVRKLERICNDFSLTSTGGTIIVDLLGRIETLEQKVREMEQLLP